MEMEQGVAKAFDVRAYHTVCYVLWNASDSALENSKATSILTDTKCYERLFFFSECEATLLSWRGHTKFRSDHENL